MKKPMDSLRTVQQIPVSYIGDQPSGPGAPQMRMSVVANVAIVQWHFAKAGDKAAAHIHPHDHQTLVARGRVAVTSGETRTEYGQDQIIVVRKLVDHQFEALQDDSVIYCIQAFRKSDLEGDIVGPDESPEEIAPLSLGARE